MTSQGSHVWDRQNFASIMHATKDQLGQKTNYKLQIQHSLTAHARTDKSSVRQFHPKTHVIRLRRNQQAVCPLTTSLVRTTHIEGLGFKPQPLMRSFFQRDPKGNLGDTNSTPAGHRYPPPFPSTCALRFERLLWFGGHAGKEDMP